MYECVCVCVTVCVCVCYECTVRDCVCARSLKIPVYLLLLAQDPFPMSFVCMSVCVWVM